MCRDRRQRCFNGGAVVLQVTNRVELRHGSIERRVREKIVRQKHQYYQAGVILLSEAFEIQDLLAGVVAADPVVDYLGLETAPVQFALENNGPVFVVLIALSEREGIAEQEYAGYTRPRRRRMYDSIAETLPSDPVLGREFRSLCDRVGAGTIYPADLIVLGQDRALAEIDGTRSLGPEDSRTCLEQA